MQLQDEVRTGALGKMFTVPKVNVDEFEGGGNKGEYRITMSDGNVLYCVLVWLNQHVKS